jgi:hypothetical protein
MTGTLGPIHQKRKWFEWLHKGSIKALKGLSIAPVIGKPVSEFSMCLLGSS